MFKICKPVLLFLIALSLCKAEFAPNSDAGMVSISMDGESLQNLLSVYENSGYHDFGTTDMLENVKEIKSVNEALHQHVWVASPPFFVDFRLN